MMNQIFDKAISMNLLKPLRKSLVISSKIFILGGISLNVYSETIFKDNFDSLPDQDIKGQCNYEGHPGKPAGICDTVPKNWAFIYTSDKNNTNPPGEILSGAGSGGGKVFRVYDESNGDNGSWGHDIQLMKHFGDAQHQELWVKVVIKFNPNLNLNGLGQAKIFRIGHYNPRVADGTAKTSIVNTNNNSEANNGLGATTAGLIFYDIREDNGSFYHRIAERGSADAEYKISRTYNRNMFNERLATTGGVDFHMIDAQGNRLTKWNETFGDGQWHTYEFRMVMNSSLNAKDGIVEVYLDGVKQAAITNVPWRQSGVHSSVQGFNAFSLAGNANFIWDGQSNAEQHFYDFDSVEVCTSRCPTDATDDVAAPFWPDQFTGTITPKQ